MTEFLMKEREGCVLFMCGAIITFHIWQMMKVGSLRRKLLSENPSSSNQELNSTVLLNVVIEKLDLQNYLNQCQRSHEAMLHNLSYNLTNLWLAGLIRPIEATTCAAFWLTGCILYHLGYAWANRVGYWTGQAALFYWTLMTSEVSFIWDWVPLFASLTLIFGLLEGLYCYFINLCQPALFGMVKP